MKIIKGSFRVPWDAEACLLFFYTLAAALMEGEKEQWDLSKYAAVWYDTREEIKVREGMGEPRLREERDVQIS